MNKTGKIILGLLLLVYLTIFLLFKYSNPQGEVKEALLGGSTMFSFTFHSNISIFILLILSFFSVDRFFSSIFKKQFLRGLLLFCISLFCIVLPGHFIATQYDGSEMREYLFFYQIKQYEISNDWVNIQIAECFDKNHNYISDNSRLRYYDTFFIRHYQVGKNETFNVFNGIGLLFNFEEGDFYKN